MRREIAAAVFFLKRLLKKNNKLESEKIDLFGERFAFILQDKFKGHWYPDRPSKGQAYRCIRINRVHRQDPDIVRACVESGIELSELGLPRELTLWVDPGEVCCRLEENKPYLTVATMSSDGDDKDVAKKVAQALERVTSDYHSGSSSDEESARSSPLTVPSHRRDSQPSAPSSPWRYRRSGRGQVFPRASRAHRPPPNFRPPAWVPPALRNPPGYWPPPQNYQQQYY